MPVRRNNHLQSVVQRDLVEAGGIKWLARPPLDLFDYQADEVADAARLRLDRLG